MCPLTLVPLFSILYHWQERYHFQKLMLKAFHINLICSYICSWSFRQQFCQLRNALDILFLDGGGFLRAGCLLVLPNTTMLQYRQKREKSDVIMNIVHASYIVSCHFLTVVRNDRHYMFLTEMKYQELNCTLDFLKGNCASFNSMNVLICTIFFQFTF